MDDGEWSIGMSGKTHADETGTDLRGTGDGGVNGSIRLVPYGILTIEDCMDADRGGADIIAYCRDRDIDIDML